MHRLTLALVALAALLDQPIADAQTGRALPVRVVQVVALDYALQAVRPCAAR